MLEKEPVVFLSNAMEQSNLTLFDVGSVNYLRREGLR
jgi:hypothetical protein